MIRMILRFLKRFWILNFFRRVAYASTYFNKKYFQILRWGFQSREYANYTYHLAPDNVLYLAQTIAVATGTPYKQILAYFEELEQDTALKDHIRQVTQSTTERRYADKEIRFHKRLGWYAFVRLMKPRIVIETGIDKGLGGVTLCAALLKNKAEGFEGQYFGTDINPAAGYLLQGRYAEVGKVLYGDSIESLKRFEQPIDLFINDSDHSARYEYEEYQTIKDKLTENAIILGDNAHVTDRLSAFCQETNRNFLYFQEKPLHHWYPGGGIGIGFRARLK